MKHTETCDQPGCTFEATFNSVAVARRVMGNHKRRKHGIIGKSNSAQWKAKQEQKAVGNSQAEEPKPRKQKHHALEANLCPVCGCNIRAVNAALNLGRRA